MVGCALALATAAFWCTTGGSAQAVTTSTTAAPTTTTEFTLKGEAKNQVDDLTAQANAVQADIDGLNDELESETEEYNKCLDDLDTANARMSELRRTVADAQADKAQRQALLGSAPQGRLHVRGPRPTAADCYSANGLDDLYNRVRLVSTLAESGPASGVRSQREHVPGWTSFSRRSTSRSAKNSDCEDELTAKGKEIQAKLARREQTLAAVDQRVRTVIDQEKQRQAAEQARLQAELQARLCRPKCRPRCSPPRPIS